MLRMITGLPGHNKTSNTLAQFLEAKDRPRFATFINGFDYEKHGVGKLETLSDLFDLPPKSLVLCDEAQTYLRPRGTKDPIPEWITQFETHRHLGIDLWYTTQHPMLIDVHVRRLTEEHYHYFRPMGLQAATTVRKWTGYKSDPTDYHAMQEAQVSPAKPPAWVFKEYTSTVEDTNKPRFPRKLIYAGIAILCAISFIGYKVNGFLSDDPVPVASSAPAVAAVPAATSPGQANFINSSGAKPLSLSDFEPVHPLLPWSAPVYAGSAKIVAVPKFSGCMASAKNGCTCVTQQGSYIEVAPHICVSVVYGKSMPFNPFKPDSPDYVPPAPDQRIAAASASPERPQADRNWSEPVEAGANSLPSSEFIPRNPL